MSKLLVVIDMQKGFDCPEARAIVVNLNKFYYYFNNVNFAMFENKKNSLFETQLKWLGFQNEDKYHKNQVFFGTQLILFIIKDLKS